MTDPTAYLTVKEAAAELGMSEDGVRKLIRRQKLRAVKRSERNTLIPRNALIAYQRKLNGTVPEPLGPVVAAGALPERLASFASLSGGRTPADWLSDWVSDANAEHDTAENMALAIDAFGLLFEQRSEMLDAPIPAHVAQMVTTARV